MPRYAAIDIGSNSTRLLVAEYSPSSQMHTLAVDREVTRLGESVFRDGRLSPSALDQISSVLTRMAGTLRQFDVTSLRAVATSAVRDTSNQAEFLDRASRAVGAPVEVISGLE